MTEIDVEELEERGFTTIPKLIDAAQLIEFEQDIARFTQAQAAKRGISLRSPDPFVDVYTSSTAYRETVYPLFERLYVFHKMSASIADFLAQSGFMAWSGIEVPLIWPEARADIPSDTTPLLPMHQDYNSTRCLRAWRMWVALRPADEERGSMRVVPGSHRRGCLPHNLDDPRHPYVEEEHYANLDEEIIRAPAGTAVLLNPLLVHGSVLNRSQMTKFTLLVQIQDLVTVTDPEDPADPLRSFRAFADARAAGRKAMGVA